MAPREESRATQGASGVSGAPATRDARVLVADDSQPVVTAIERMLAAAGYAQVFTTTESGRVVTLCEALDPDVVLLDLGMPPPDGFEILRQLRERGPKGPPVIVLTGHNEPAARNRALSLGAADFVPKPFERVELLLRLRNVLALRRHMADLERQVQLRTADLEHARLELLSRLALTAEFRDDQTHQHTQRVGRTSFQLARRLAPQQADVIRDAAQLHDIGKVGIPDAVLMKPSTLSAEEYRTIQTHTEIGGKILANSKSPVLSVAEEIALTHHERWDGNGYPRGLAGRDIPLVGRIAAVADTFDAMTHDRPYRRACRVEHAVGEVVQMAGSQFDPEVVAAFVELDHAALLTDVT